LTIASTFTVAWVPYQMNHIVLSYGNRDHALLIINAVETLTYVNSCVNPVIYALMWRPFRQSLIQVRRACLTRLMPIMFSVLFILASMYIKHYAAVPIDMICYHNGLTLVHVV